MINKTGIFSGTAAIAGVGALVLIAAAWLRGAEYDEQYTLFLTAGVPRPAWPEIAFPAGLAREFQSGRADFAGIGRDLRIADVHPPLYFWLISLWRAALGDGLFAARLFSVGCGVAALTLTGAIARRVAVTPARAMLFTLGCYAFAYTSCIARGFALAQLLLLGGVFALLGQGRRGWMGGAMLGAATLTNYLAVFPAMACLAMAGWSRGADRAWRGACVGFLVFLPADAWWFLAQRGSRADQFPPFALLATLTRLARSLGGAVLGGTPLYFDGIAAAVILGLLLAAACGRIAWHWPRVSGIVAVGAAAPAAGLLALGIVFDNTPIEVRYLAFAAPFIGILMAGGLGSKLGVPIAVAQAVGIAGLMLAPTTMQPARAAARAAAALAEGGIVVLPYGNDGVGIVGAFAIECPPAQTLLLVRGDETTARLRQRLIPYRRVVLALLEQDSASRAAARTMRAAMSGPDWREIANRGTIATYERIRDGG